MTVDDEPVIIASYPFRTQAEAARLRLEADGIRAALADSETLDQNWLFGNAVGWIKLQVPGDSAAKAAAILSQIRPRDVHRRWRVGELLGLSEPSKSMTNADSIDDLERQVYELKLQVATLFRVLTTKGLSTPEELRALMEKVDAEDGAADGEFFGDPIEPPPPA